MHQTPDPTGRIANMKLIPDDMPDPVQGPVVLTVSVSIGAAQQFLFQLSDLLLGQIGWLARRCRTRLPRMLLLAQPTVYALDRYTHFRRDLFYRFALFQQIQGFFTASRKLFVGPLGSHTSNYAAKSFG